MDSTGDSTWADALAIGKPTNIHLKASDDGGHYSHDGITNIEDPTIEWTAPSGNINQYHYQYQEYQDSSWTKIKEDYVPTPYVNFGSDLNDGTYIFQVQAEERDTWEWSEWTVNYEFVVDTVKPSAPDEVKMATSDDYGYSDADGITNVKRPSFEWKAPSDSSDIGKYHTLFQTSGSVNEDESYPEGTSAAPDEDLKDGDHKFLVQAEDLAGNWSDWTTAKEFTIDTSAPETPWPWVYYTSDTGNSNQDSITKDTTPRMDWNAVDGAYRYWYDFGDSTPNNNTTDLNWTPSNALPEGKGEPQKFYLKAEDKAGNQSSNGYRQVTIDITAPTLPSAVHMREGDDTGNSITDAITKTKRPTFEWTASTDSSTVVKYHSLFQTIEGVTVSEAYPTGTSVAPDKDLTDGKYKFLIQAEDLAGNWCTWTEAIGFVVDNSVNTPANVHMRPEDDTGNLDNITTNRRPHFDWDVPDDLGGIAKYQCLFQEIDGTTIQQTYPTSNSEQPDNDLNKGEYKFLVQAEDLAGNWSLWTDSPIEFTITDVIAQPIEVVSPNNNESLERGKTHNIQWTDTIEENVEIVLLKDGIEYGVIEESTESDGSYLWWIPTAFTIGNDYKIEIRSTEDNDIVDWSDYNFSIVLPVIKITSPNSSVSLKRGRTYNIQWTDSIDENVKIVLLKDGGEYGVIEESTESDGSYSWTILSNIEAGSDYKIEIRSTEDNDVVDWSDYDFSIILPITVTTPNGYERLERGKFYDIQWTDTIEENVEIVLLKDGTEHSVIEESTESDGSYSWWIPTAFTIGKDYKIEIRSTKDHHVVDWSDENFMIGPILVTSPDGTKSLQRGETYNIQWVDNIDENVKIVLLKDGIPLADAKGVIEEETESDGRYSWDVPTDLDFGSGYQIKISSVKDPSAFGMSNELMIRELSAAADSVLDYLYARKYGENNRIVAGQFVGYAYDMDNNFMKYVDDLSPRVAMYGTDLQIWGRDATERQEAIKTFIEEVVGDKNVKGDDAIATISWHAFKNEKNAEEEEFQDAVKDNFDGFVKEVLKNPTPNNKGTPAQKWMAALEATYESLKHFKDNDVAVLWRPLHEMNGNWFWWDQHNNSTEAYKDLWRHMFDYLTFEKEESLDNLLWVYAPGEPGTVDNTNMAGVMEHYPGDEYVDVFGIDV
ncbi:Ig-like domain-containing protein, partial [Planctomycetota bacterium]